MTREFTLAATDFVRRFLRHVLPRGFVRVRHFGLQANVCRTQLIPRAMLLLGTPADPTPDPHVCESWQALFQRLTGRDPMRCPYCQQGTLRLVSAIAPLPPGRGP